MYFESPSKINVKFNDDDLANIAYITQTFETLCNEMRANKFNCLSTDDNWFDITQIEELTAKLQLAWDIVDSNAKIYHD